MSEPRGGRIQAVLAWGLVLPGQVLATGFLVGVGIKASEMMVGALLPFSDDSASRVVSIAWFLLLAAVSIWVLRRLLFIHRYDTALLVPRVARVAAVLCLPVSWLVWAGLCLS